jgi:hypothetical protein
MNKPLTQQQQALLEQYIRTRAAWQMAVGREDDAELGTACAAALSACIAVGVDPFHYLQPQ